MRIFITGIGGMVGAAVARYLHSEGCDVAGCDDDSRGRWFGEAGSVQWRIEQLRKEGFEVIGGDIRKGLDCAGYVDGVVHCAGQPSHDYSKLHITEDAIANYMSTVFLAEWLRESPRPTVFLSTNKVYGDVVNTHVIYEIIGERYVPRETHSWLDPYYGVNETCPSDFTSKTPFGVSKTAADQLMQEMSRCFGVPTCVLRCGCLTGESGSAVELHGFLGYLARCAKERKPYTIYGHGGFQVRDNLAVRDLARAIFEWLKAPTSGVFNMGGGRGNSISVKEAIRHLNAQGFDFPTPLGTGRYGDHKWWVSDTRRFQLFYPNWAPRIGVREVLNAMVEC